MSFPRALSPTCFDLAAPVYAVQSRTPPQAHPGSRTPLLGPKAGPTQERAHSPAYVTSRAPPIFLVHAEDDATMLTGNTLGLRAALVAAGVPVETHLFTHGGHGSGPRRAMGKPAAVWPDLFLARTRAMGFS